MKTNDYIVRRAGNNFFKTGKNCESPTFGGNDLALRARPVCVEDSDSLVKTAEDTSSVL